MYFDEDGQPISPDEWGRKFEDLAGRTLAEDPVPGGTLRTVWLGLVDGTIDGARLFGSAFIRDGGGADERETYDSKEAALEGHQRHLSEMQGSTGS